MYNLIQIQDAIKGFPVEDVMKYARGANPDVPAYLALAELNRRKQLQDTAAAFYGEPQTVREQIESSLTGAPANQVNPTIGSQTANPTATPPQLQTLTAPPPKPQMPQMPMVPPQMNPTQAPPVPQMRKGGLASLPVGMFKRANYAGGGIIAFQEGGATDRSAFQQDLIDLFGYSKEKDTSPYERDIKPRLEKLKSYFTEPRPQAVGPATTTAQAEAQDMEGSSAKEPTVKPNQQASATSSGQITKREPVEPTFGQRVTVTQPPIADLTYEQLLEKRRKLQELAGVSPDPYADIKKRYSDIEARRAEQAKEDPTDRLMHRLASFATSKAQDFGVSMGESALSTQKFQKEQEALRDKQASTMAELQMNMAKEEDARRRGDVTAVEALDAAQKKNRMDLAELEIKRTNAQANMIQATRPAAEVQMIERVMKDKNMTFAEAMEYLQGIKGINALRVEADKNWNDDPLLRKQWESKGGYDAYMASKGLSPSGRGAAQQSTATPKEGDKAVSKSGKPIVYRNGKWEYQ